MTAPNDPTEPISPGEPGTTSATEAQLRDALAARADAVTPPAPDVDALHRAVAADRAHRRRRASVVAGAAAALLLAGLGLVAVLPDDAQQVNTGTTADGSTTAATAETVPSTPTTMRPSETTTTVPATTSTAPPTTAAPTTAPPTTVPTLAGASFDPRSGSGAGPVPALMTDIRVGANDGFDRVVLEFADGARPTYTVSYVDPPITEDASGAEVSLAGTAFLQIHMSGTEAHTFDGEVPVATYTGPKRFSPGTAQVLEVVNTGEFEAVYTWVVGVAHRAPFRVSTLTSPSRLVIDIARP